MTPPATAAVTYSVHLVDCPTAVEADAPIEASSLHEDTPRHKCCYYADPFPAQVRVMTHPEEQ